MAPAMAVAVAAAMAAARAAAAKARSCCWASLYLQPTAAGKGSTERSNVSARQSHRREFQSCARRRPWLAHAGSEKRTSKNIQRAHLRVQRLLQQAQGRSTSHSRFYHANACADLAYDADVDARLLLGVIGCQPTSPVPASKTDTARSWKCTCYDLAARAPRQPW